MTKRSRGPSTCDWDASRPISVVVPSSLSRRVLTHQSPICAGFWGTKLRGHGDAVPDDWGTGGGGPTTVPDDWGTGGGPTTEWDENGGGGRPTTVGISVRRVTLVGDGLRASVVQISPNSFSY